MSYIRPIFVQRGENYADFFWLTLEQMYDILQIMVAYKTRLEQFMLEGIVDNDMLFYTFDDFMKIRKHIKKKLRNKKSRDYIIYRMYVESRPWIKDFFRCCIWDFLNDYMTDAELMHEYDKYLAKYGDKNE